GSALGDSQGDRGGEEEFAANSYVGNHDSAPDSRALRQRAGAAEACEGRNGRDRGWASPGGDSGGGNTQRADQVDWDAQSSQCSEGSRRRARAVARQGRDGGIAGVGRREGILMRDKIKIKLVRSPICTPEKHKVIVRSLGLRKINQVVERPDTPGFRGMVKKIPHLLAVVE